jgi:flagellar biosynthesis protein FliQ
MGGKLMNSDFVVGLMAEAIKVTLLISAPVLIVGLVVGVVISLIQAVTQIQEMTLVFVPKIIAVMVVLVAALPWMINIMITYTHNLITSIPVSIK